VPDSRAYIERLWPPPSWWLADTGLVAAVWLVLVVSTPAPLVAAGTVVAAVSVLGGLAACAVTVGVRDGEVVAGRARLPVERCAAVEPLDVEAARRARGVDADARAFLLLRPYLARAVRVRLDDPHDPTPYWLLSARRPERIAAAAAAARSPRPAGPGTAR